MHRLRGAASVLFALPLPSPLVPTVRLIEVAGPTLVLGSTQADLAAPAPALSVEVAVVRRRSGGGAVLLQPGGVLWADVVVPAGDRRWDADVGRAFWWLGDVWAETVAAAPGPASPVVHRGPLRRSPWSDVVCFAGLGPGEVTIEGRKVVGISQRRTREAALFQCAALLAWDPDGIAAMVGVPAADLATVATGLGGDTSALEAAFLAALARS